MKNPFFPAIDLKQHIAQVESDILRYWQDEEVFQKTIDCRSKYRPFVFFDGPPFATGTPHYGHLLAGTIKDAIPRYWTMKGYRVERKFGWDCHGLPVEYQVEKEQKIGGKPEIEKMGVGKFNEMCRSIVQRCRDEWEETVDRMGRFVDFQDDYKTMDPEFMESVWWVFAQLWNKGLIYEGEKVVAYSPKLGSPLSNFEANLNYQKVSDPAVMVKFQLNDEDVPTYILAWTTTPWTLPSNVALGFGRDTEYVVVSAGAGNYIVAKAVYEREVARGTSGMLGSLFVDEVPPSVVKTFVGSDMKGRTYQPLFDFFKDSEVESAGKRFVCLHDDGDYVSTDSGTGVVHFAPSFGAEDADLCAKFDVSGVNPIDENGYFTDEVQPLQGRYFRADEEVDGSKDNNANDWVITDLKDRGLLFKKEQVTHDYPFCWRTDCALMYRGIKTWFVKVSAIKDQMIEQNQKVNWTPSHIKDGRFGKILETAPDWAISRNRYWGTPLPVWRCDKTGAVEVVTSRADLESKTGQKVEDLHRHFIDDLTWENPETGGTMRRIEEVLDCWFESGSMPYASQHYPFDHSVGFNSPIELRNDFYILRHGESVSNVEKINICRRDQDKGFGLTEKGRDQAAQAAKSLPAIDMIVTSSLERTQQTAAQIGARFGTEVQTDDRLIEIDLGDFDGQPYHASMDYLQEIDVVQKPFPGGESLQVVQDRMWSLLVELNEKHQGKKIVLVSHGGCISALKQKFSPRPLRFPPMAELPKNAEICHLNELTTPPEAVDFRSANFICEGMDQTRGWFYTLHVLGTALFGKNIFDNVVCTGLILAEDGQKMSKSKKNYPDPAKIFDAFGADALRFYLLQSPVATKGENLRFSEKGVEEVLKNIILPLRSSYQFLSTYATIDGWQPTRFVWMRHGQAEHNLLSIYASEGGREKYSLTHFGKKQVMTTAQNLPSLDVAYSSPLLRTRETMDLALQTAGFDLEYEIDERLREVDFGTLDGGPVMPVAERIKFDTEPLQSIRDRTTDFMREKAAQHPGKTIFVTSHGALVRAGQLCGLGIDDDKRHLEYPEPRPGDMAVVFMRPEPQTELDQWILAELEELIGSYTAAFEQYDLEKALKKVAPFIDKMNNWYLRRSRARFWAEGLSAEKVSGYQTLHYVLYQLSRVLAPICPFFTDDLFQKLGGGESVHLSAMPVFVPEALRPELQQKTNLIREIVGLGAAIRSRQTIKLRQPLQKLQFQVAEHLQAVFDESDLEIIRLEANVKEVALLPSLDGIAKPILKLNAKKLGPKFGKAVQPLIQAAKAGEFTENPDGSYMVNGARIEAEEAEKGFLSESGYDAEATREVVVVLDTEISKSLEQEGFARDLIRVIQEQRKAQAFAVSDRIKIRFHTDSEKLLAVIEAYKDMIGAETLTVEMTWESDPVGVELEVDGAKLFLNLSQA